MEWDPQDHRGFDLNNLDETSQSEIDNFRNIMLERRNGTLMHPLSGYSYMLRNRPDMVKRFLRYLDTTFVIPGEGSFKVIPVSAFLAWYVANRFEAGIIHEMRSIQDAGGSKAQVNELISIAYVNAGPSGLHPVYQASNDYMHTYVDRPEPAEFPEGWGPDPEALKSGLDMSKRDFTAADKKALFGWYEKTIGEVPRSVQFLARHDSASLKGWRVRLEGTMRGALPKQMLPYIMIHQNTCRGFAGGLREGTILGRAWGMTKAQVVHAMALALNAGMAAGLDSCYIADEAVGDLLDADW